MRASVTFVALIRALGVGPVLVAACAPAVRVSASDLHRDPQPEARASIHAGAADAAGDGHATPSPSAIDPGSVGRANTCREPLSRHCAGFPAGPGDDRLCGPYDEALARLQRTARKMCPNHDATLAMGDAYVRTETCGPFRVLAWAGLFGSERAFYDGRGTLLAIETTSDVSGSCEGHMLPSGWTYGDAPECAMTEERSLCP